MIYVRNLHWVVSLDMIWYAVDCSCIHILCEVAQNIKLPSAKHTYIIVVMWCHSKFSHSASIYRCRTHMIQRNVEIPLIYASNSIRQMSRRRSLIRPFINHDAILLSSRRSDCARNLWRNSFEYLYTRSKGLLFCIDVHRTRNGQYFHRLVCMVRFQHPASNRKIISTLVYWFDASTLFNR